MTKKSLSFYIYITITILTTLTCPHYLQQENIFPPLRSEIHGSTTQLGQAETHGKLMMKTNKNPVGMIEIHSRLYMTPIKLLSRKSLKADKVSDH